MALPTKIGENIYASNDGVFIYNEPDLNSEKFGNLITKGDITFNQDELIGSYAGETKGSFCNVSFSYTFRPAPLLPKVTKSYVGWVLLPQISTETVKKTDEKQKEQAKQAKLDGVLGQTNNSLTGNANTSTTTKLSTNLILIIVATLLAVLVGIIVFFRRKGNRNQQNGYVTINPQDLSQKPPLYRIK